eukprot:jgi/Mesen1/166/ME1132363C07689
MYALRRPLRNTPHLNRLADKWQSLNAAQHLKKALARECSSARWRQEAAARRRVQGSASWHKPHTASWQHLRRAVKSLHWQQQARSSGPYEASPATAAEENNSPSTNDVITTTNNNNNNNKNNNNSSWQEEGTSPSRAYLLPPGIDFQLSPGDCDTVASAHLPSLVPLGTPGLPAGMLGAAGMPLGTPGMHAGTQEALMATPVQVLGRSLGGTLQGTPGNLGTPFGTLLGTPSVPLGSLRTPAGTPAGTLMVSRPMGMPMTTSLGTSLETQAGTPVGTPAGTGTSMGGPMETPMKTGTPLGTPTGGALGRLKEESPRAAPPFDPAYRGLLSPQRGWGAFDRVAFESTECHRGAFDGGSGDGGGRGVGAGMFAPESATCPSLIGGMPMERATRARRPGLLSPQ